MTNLYAAMLKIAGFVSCQVTGSDNPISVELTGTGMQTTFSTTSANDPYGSAHQWMEVWVPSLQEWITLDPTWDLDSPFGDVQSQINISRSVMTINFLVSYNFPF